MNEPTTIRVALLQHYGWHIYEIVAATLAEAAYQAVRISHPFLDDSNHTYSAGRREMVWGGRLSEWTSVMIDKNETSPKSLMAPAGHVDGPGQLWFGITYREAAPGEQNPPWIQRSVERAERRKAYGVRNGCIGSVRECGIIRQR